MHFQKTAILGLQIITLPKFDDDRGSFVKTFHQELFQKEAAHFELRESYFSISNKGVIRGMHFQLPPHEHEKIVFCPQGSILDVIVDLRKDSITYGKHESVLLNAANHTAVFIPKGCAHGFASLEDNTITYYLVSSMYNKDNDTGILYDSFSLDWQIENPIVSERDLGFLNLKDFDSPF